MALLEPRALLRQYELNGDFSSRLALQEELKAFPVGAVWDYYCVEKGVPVALAAMDTIRDYQRTELSKRI